MGMRLAESTILWGDDVVGLYSDDVDLEILRMMRQGLADQAIAQRLGVGHRTVQRRIQLMMDRAEARGRFALGVRIGELGVAGEGS